MTVPVRERSPAQVLGRAGEGSCAEEDGCCASTWDGSALGSGGGESRAARVRIALQFKQAAKKMSANLRREILHAQTLAMAQRPGDGGGSCCPHVDEHVVDETLLRLGSEMPHPFSKLLEAVAATSPSWSRLLDRVLGAAEEKLAACIVARDLLQEAHWPLSLGQRRVREDQCLELDKLRVQHKEARQRICDLDAHVVRLERRISRYRDQLRSAENALDGCQCTQRSGSISGSMKARESGGSLPNLASAPSSAQIRSARHGNAGAGALSEAVAATAAAAGLATAAAQAAAAAAMDGDTAPLATPSDKAAAATNTPDLTAANAILLELGGMLQPSPHGCSSTGGAPLVEQQDSAPPRCSNAAVAGSTDAAARLASVSRRRRATSLSPLPPNVRTVQISLASEEDRSLAAYREARAANASAAGSAVPSTVHADISPGPGPLLDSGPSRRGGERRSGRRSAASSAVLGGAARTPSGRGTRGRLTMGGEHSSSYTRLPGSGASGSSTGPSSGTASATIAAYPHAKSLLRTTGTSSSSATSAAAASAAPPPSTAASCEALTSAESPHRSHFQQVLQHGLSPAPAVTAGARVPTQLQRTPPSSGIRKSASGKRHASTADGIAATAASTTASTTSSAGSGGGRGTAMLPRSPGPPIGGGSRSGCSMSSTSSIRQGYPASRSTAAVQQQQGQPPGPWAVVLGAQVQQSSPGSMVTSSTPVSASLSPAAVSPMALAGQVSSPLRKRCHVTSSAALQAPSAWRHQ